MEEIRKYLKIASIINCVLGILTLSFFVYSALLLIFGIIFYNLSTKEKSVIQKKRSFLLVMAIVFFFLSPLTSIFLFIAHGKLSDYERQVHSPNSPPSRRIKRVVDPEVRKIDILLKLGVGMVFVSGILFATTSWDFVSDGTKAVLLIFFGILFLGLSFFTEKKLELYRTSYIYWILSMSFFLLTIVGMLFFGIFGDMLTYGGTGKFLAYFITCFTITGLSIATYLKFPKSYILYITYTSILVGITYLLVHMKIENGIILIIISGIVFLASFFSKKETVLYLYSRLMTYGMVGFILKRIEDSSATMILLASFINIVNQYYWLSVEKEEQSLHLGLIYILVAISLLNTKVFENSVYVIIWILYTLQTVAIKMNLLKLEEKSQKVNYIFYTIAALFIFFINYTYATNISLITALIYLFINILVTKKIQNTKKIEFAIYLEPVIILLILTSFFQTNWIGIEVHFSMTILLASILYGIRHWIVTEEKQKKVYFLATFIGILASIEYNLVEKEILPAILMFLPSSYLLFISIHQEEDISKIASYILFLLGIYNFLTIINVLELSTVISSFIFIWILSIVIVIGNDDKLKTTSYFAIALPIYDIVNFLDYSYIWKSIVTSILYLYITFLILKFFVKENPEAKNIVGVIGVILSLTPVAFSEDYIAGIYIGILGIVIIILGYNKKELKSFFIMGILITVINILYQLRDLWGVIPFWLYLLIGGLTLIGFVTYKELKKSKER